MAFSGLLDIHSRDLTSEAEVETRLLQPLFKHLGYPPTAIKPKKQLKPLIVNEGSKKKTIEADFLLLRQDGSAKVIVETKDPTKSVQDAWGQAASYALSYNHDKPPEQRAKWLLISNGHITSLYQHDSSTPTITLELSNFVSGSPPYVQLKSLIKHISADEIPHSGLSFEVKTPSELNALFNECHDIVWKKEKLSPTDAFFEFCKFIFLKIREDKERELSGVSKKPYELPMTLSWLEAQKANSKHPVYDKFVKLRDELEDEIIEKHKKRIFEKGETFKLSASTCFELIKRFEKINLASIDEDLNGRMFEVFLNAAVRGKELGQYFTPRPLVDFMTRIALFSKDNLLNPPKVIDGSCGTAGFLIEAMAYMITKIKGAKNINNKKKDELKDTIRNECLYGIEANERVSRIARINMYLHGDGGSHIFHGDGLDNDPIEADDMNQERKNDVKDHHKKIQSSSFDIVLTNPPFSMSYSSDNKDEERILRQLSIADQTESSKSNILFLQRYYDLLKPGGEMLIVLDDTVLNGATHESVRTWILEKFVLLAVHSMPFNAFFKAKANIKTSAIHIRKKVDASEGQQHVFMSISNNIGHDNSLKDTPHRNNLNDIFSAYSEWKEKGIIPNIFRHNADPRENLECPEQAWLVAPDDITIERIDAFFYAPDLINAWETMNAAAKTGQIEIKKGSDLTLRTKISKKQKTEMKTSGKQHRYIEISDVTRYGLITSYIEGSIDALPTRGEYIIHEGDVLFAINNSSRGTVVLVPKEFDGAICTSGFLVIKPKTKEEGYLLWYALRSEHCRAQIYYLAQTASQPELKREAWNNYFQIPIPTGQEKKKALHAAEAFQENLSALLDADSIRFGAKNL